AAATAAVRTARARGLSVVFDGNYRSKLWQAWNNDPGPILRDIFACADILFADHRDIAIVLGREFTAASTEQCFADAAAAAFDAFAPLQRIVSTRRVQHSVDHHELSAIMATRAGTVTSPAQQVTSIVDRIGAGD